MANYSDIFKRLKGQFGSNEIAYITHSMQDGKRLESGKIVRKLAINECYKLMGFPGKFIRSSSLAEQYRQIGNSGCIPMIKSVVKQIKEQMLWNELIGKM